MPTSQFNRGPFQELNRHNQADFPNVIRPVVKRSFQPSRVDMLPLALRQAVTTMTSGRPGPVNVDIPFNLFQEEADVALEPEWHGFELRRSGGSPEDIQNALDMVLQAKRPVIFIGHGMTLSEGSKELTEFAHALQHPGDQLSQRHGLPGHDRPAVAGIHRQERRLSRRTRPAATPTWCWRSARASTTAPPHPGCRAIPGIFRSPSSFTSTSITPRSDATTRPDLGVLADARIFLVQMLGELSRRKVDKSARLKAWHADIAEWRAEWEAYIKPNFEIHASPLRPERIVADCRAVLPRDAIIRSIRDAP